jgi:hypothetical protein
MDKIALDKRIIGALASETRIGILKKIDYGSMTLSKLTDEVNILISGFTMSLQARARRFFTRAK